MAKATPTPAATSVLDAGQAPPPPVFVDESGARRRRWRRVAIWLGAAALLLVAVLWLSQAGGSVNPEPVLPCPTTQAPERGERPARETPPGGADCRSLPAGPAGADDSQSYGWVG